MIAYLVTSLWILTIIGWIIFNLYNKNKKLEAMVLKQNTFITDMVTLMKGLDKTVDKIDSTIWVQTDPSLLELFDSVKNFQSSIKQYTDLI